jgi:alpha-beta hydrolase superfamily lysophospholipase
MDPMQFQGPVRVTSGRLVAADGLRLSWWWAHAREGSPVATVLLHHGFAEHSGRHGHVVSALAEAGVDVVLYDARGHGASGGRRGHVDRFADYVADLRQMIAYVTTEAKQPPFLVAHSQGGLVATYAALDAPLAVRGVILTNPALAASVDVPAWKIGAAKLLSRLLPTVALPIGIPPEHISRDSASVDDYRDDPLIFSDGTTRWGAEFLAAQERVLAGHPRFDVPLLVLIGSGDRVVNPSVSGRFYPTVQASELNVEVFEGYYHELFNEPLADRLRVLAMLRQWLLARA